MNNIVKVNSLTDHGLQYLWLKIVFCNRKIGFVDPDTAWKLIAFTYFHQRTVINQFAAISMSFYDDPLKGFDVVFS